MPQMRRQQMRITSKTPEGVEVTLSLQLPFSGECQERDTALHNNVTQRYIALHSVTYYDNVTQRYTTLHQR